MLQSEPKSPHISQLSSFYSYKQCLAGVVDETKTNKKQKKCKTKQSYEEHRHHKTNVHPLYHGIFTIFQCHNPLSYNSKEEELIKKLLTSRRLVGISPTRSKNAEVALWCVCFWPLVPKWGPVKHEIPISSPPLDDIPSIP
jgi:hypothetical protein